MYLTGKRDIPSIKPERRLNAPLRNQSGQSSGLRAVLQRETHMTWVLKAPATLLPGMIAAALLATPTRADVVTDWNVAANAVMAPRTSATIRGYAIWR